MIQISKDDFERALPAGQSSHEEVYESVLPSMEEQQVIYEKEMLGDAGIAMVEKEETVANLFYKKMVCQSAFLSVLPQLDLVLTPSGFGVVSNDNVAPASKERVEALKMSLKEELFKSTGMMVDTLRSAEWGVTTQAKRYIRSVYDRFYFAYRRDPRGTFEEWKMIQDEAQVADNVLRMRISNEQMDDILDAYRCDDSDRLAGYYKVIGWIQLFVDRFGCGAKPFAMSIVLRNIIKHMEENAETFTLYMNSSAYTLNHYENFQNSKDSTAYLFNG